jgi:hypothetical protein
MSLTMPPSSEQITIAELEADVRTWQTRANMLEGIMWRVFCLLLSVLPKDRIDDAINRLIARAQVVK